MTVAVGWSRREGGGGRMRSWLTLISMTVTTTLVETAEHWQVDLMSRYFRPRWRTTVCYTSKSAVEVWRLVERASRAFFRHRYNEWYRSCYGFTVRLAHALCSRTRVPEASSSSSSTNGESNNNNNGNNNNREGIRAKHVLANVLGQGLVKALFLPVGAVQAMYARLAQLYHRRSSSSNDDPHHSLDNIKKIRQLRDQRKRAEKREREEEKRRERELHSSDQAQAQAQVYEYTDRRRRQHHDREHHNHNHDNDHEHEHEHKPHEQERSLVDRTISKSDLLRTPRPHQPDYSIRAVYP